MTELPPFVVFFVAALLVAVSGARVRTALTLAAPIVSGGLLLGTELGRYGVYTIMDYHAVLFRFDALSRLFGYLFNLAALIAAVYALHDRDRSQQLAALVFAGSALGAVMAGDLITLFVFWELLALSSVFLIWARGTERAYRAGMRYLLTHLLGGGLLLAGILAHIGAGESIGFDFIGADSAAGWLILVAFGIKAGFPLVHNWITDAYPEGTPSGTVYLSSFTTKVGVYALARGYPGTELLIYVGTVMAAYPIFFAVIENDLRRVLSYSLINQLGFMVCAIGIGTELALNGAVAQTFSHVIFKGLLFMSMGAVLHMTGRINGSDLGGLYKSMPITTVLCIIGAASISAFPLFSGFVTKSMIMSAVLGENYVAVWLVLLFASAGVFHHAGIKIPFFASFAHDAGIRTTDPPRNMLAAMGIAAALCLAIGIWPEYLYALLPYPVNYAPYTADHVLAQIQLLFFSALAFIWLKLSGIYPPELNSVNLDVEWLYRRAAPRAWRRLVQTAVAINARLDAATGCLLRWLLDGIVALLGVRGIFARSQSTGTMVLWMVALLGALLVSYYV